MDLRIIDTVIHPSHLDFFYVKKSTSRDKFKVYIALEGNDAPFVESVVYYLHHSFKTPRISVKRSIQNPNCEISIWTWGLFTVKAQINLKNGAKIELDHYLSYDKQIKSNPSIKAQTA